MNIDQLMSKLPNRRGKARNRSRTRGAYRKRTSLSQADLIRYLVDHDVRTTGRLRRIRQSDDPSVYDYIKEFRSWSQAVVAAFGQPQPFTAPSKPSPEYLARCVMEFGLWRREDWCRARKRDPATIPSLHHCRRLFKGRFANLTWVAERLSAKRTLERYLELAKGMGGRRPTPYECYRHGVDLGPLLAIYQDRKELDGFLEMATSKMLGTSVQNFSETSPAIQPA